VLCREVAADMAVFTRLERSDVEAFLAHYALGELGALQAISEGIENTNFFVDTVSPEGDSRRWVLTVFETLDSDELPYFCHLTRFLEGAGFSVPAPVLTGSGQAWGELKGKPAILVPCLSGKSCTHTEVSHCREIGAWLAHLHLAQTGFGESRPLVRDLDWVQQQASILADRMPKKDAERLTVHVRRYEQYQNDLLACPQGTVHGDLFRDNVLFEAGRISGVIDFYHACDATLLFDLAVVANDWAVDASGRHDPERLYALEQSYQDIRPWTDAEHKAWAACLELAALRFWISRLASWYLPGYQQRTESGDALKDPDEMKAILAQLVPLE